MTRASAPSPAAPGGLPPPLGLVDLLLRFAAVVASASAAISVGSSSLMVVRQVQVVGARHLPAQAVASAAGVRVGQRLAEVDPSRMVEGLRRHPRIARASVQVFPGRVVLRIEERIPQAAVPYRGGYLVVDREAVVIGRAAEPGPLPVVSADRAPPWAQAGDRLPVPGLLEAVRLVDRLPAEEVRAGVQVRVRPGGGVEVITADGLSVLLGPAATAAQRTAVLPAALRAARSHTAAVVDLRFAGSVYLRSGGVPP